MRFSQFGNITKRICDVNWAEVAPDDFRKERVNAVRNQTPVIPDFDKSSLNWAISRFQLSFVRRFKKNAKSVLK